MLCRYSTKKVVGDGERQIELVWTNKNKEGEDEEEETEEEAAEAAKIEMHKFSQGGEEHPDFRFLFCF